jgi:antitoxin VapB
MPMPLSFEDGEILDLARELAALSGETLTAAIRTALEEKLGRARMLRGVDREFAERTARREPELV